MTFDDIIRDFATTGATLPRASMRWVLDHWEEAGPPLLALLDQFVRGEACADDTVMVLFFALHLMAERRERRAFPLLCQLVRDFEAIERILGDGLTVTLSRIMLSTFDGQTALVTALIEDDGVDEFIRHISFEVWTGLTHHGVVSREESRAYLLELYREMRPQGENFAWAGWADAAITLGLSEARPLVESLLKRGFIDPLLMDIEDFDSDLAQVVADPASVSRIERFQPLDDAIAELAGWSSFRPGQTGTEPAASVLPVVNPFRAVGRNDPCPCGSGKKFKACCLP